MKQSKNHIQNSPAQGINHPPVFTTKPGLASQHIDAWEMLNSCWDQCSGLLWSSQGCVVSTELFWQFRWRRDQCIFMCVVFAFHPANQLSVAPSSHTTGASAASPPVRAFLLCEITSLKNCLEYISHSY